MLIYMYMWYKQDAGAKMQIHPPTAPTGSLLVAGFCFTGTATTPPSARLVVTTKKSVTGVISSPILPRRSTGVRGGGSENSFLLTIRTVRKLRSATRRWVNHLLSDPTSRGRKQPRHKLDTCGMEDPRKMHLKRRQVRSNRYPWVHKCTFVYSCVTL